MGATYTRQSSYSDGDTITAAHTNDEFQQLLAAFAKSSGHTHDGTDAEGGPITDLMGNTINIGSQTVSSTTFGTINSDTTINFNKDDTNSGQLLWDTSADAFQFNDDILINSTEKLQFRDTAIYLNSSTDGQLDIVADTEIQLAATTVDLNGNLDVSGSLTLGGTAITSTAAELNILDGVTATASELNILDGVTATATELNIMDGGTSATSTTLADADRVVVNDNGTMVQVALTDFETYFESALDTLSNVTTVGTLNSGAISSGFGNIDVGSSNLTATGTVSLGATSFNDNNITNVGSIQLDSLAGDADTDTSITFSGSDVITVATGGTTALTIDASQNVTVAGDLTVSGDDITMATNTAGNLLVADGTNFNSIAVGSLSEISTVANDDVFLAVDTSGGGLKKITRSAIVSGLAASGAAISNVVEDTTPQLGGNLDTNSHNILIDDAHFIADENGNEQIIFQTTSSAVNQFDITNAATGNAPELSATGGDTNISLKITPKGSGQVLLDGNVGIESGLIDLKNGGSRSQIKFYCESGNAHAQTLRAAPHSESASNTLTLPSTGGDVDLVSTASTATLTNKTLTSPKINEDVAVTATATELNIMDGVTATTSELNIMDGVTSTATELNLIDGSSAGTIVNSKAVIYGSSGEVNATTLQIGGTSIGSTAAELNLLDGSAKSTSSITVADSDALIIIDGTTTKQIPASDIKTYVGSTVGSQDLNGEELVLDADADTSITADTDDQIDIKIAGADDFQFTANTFTALSGSGIVVPDGGLTFGSTAITSTAAELNILDGVTSTTAELNILDGVTSTATELNIIDGNTSATSTTLADADRVVVNDNGTMVQVALTDFETYFESALDTLSNVTTVGALNSGSITSGFGNIDNGSSTITTTGAISGGSLTANGGVTIDNITIDGTEIDLSSGDLTLDVAGDIVLDAAGEQVIFKDGSTNVGHVDLDSDNFTLKSLESDKDFIIKGNDGGSEITALTLDMSAAGAATFNNNVTAFSDERLKSNIETMEGGLEKVEQLRGVTYTRDDMDNIGVIAQEVEKVLPEIVLTADDEMGTKSVDYSRITAVLIEAVKELSAKVKYLEENS